MPWNRRLSVILLRCELLWRNSFHWEVFIQFLVIESGFKNSDLALELGDLVIIFLFLLLDLDFELGGLGDLLLYFLLELFDVFVFDI